MPERICVVPYCAKRVQAHGYCPKHYAHIRLHGSVIDQSERSCGWCGESIAHLSTRASYCSLQHKKNAASKRHRERNPGYYSALAKTPKRSAYLQAYAEANRERARQYSRERQRRLREENPEAVAAQSRAWWVANADKHRLYQANRRFRQAMNPGSVGVTERDWMRLLRRYAHSCAYCGVKADSLHMDHVVPLRRGGRHAIGNVLPACQSCNLSKSARLLADWRSERRGHGRRNATPGAAPQVLEQGR